MKPGIYRNLPAADYHAIDAASSHRLSLLARSPAHCREAVLNPKPSTESMICGSVTHTVILEPHLLDERYVVAGQCCATKAKGDRCDNPGKYQVAGDDGWLCGVHAKGKPTSAPTREVVTQEAFDTCRHMTDAVRKHAAAGYLLSQATDRELSVVWNCRETMELSKLRADSLSVLADMRVLIDLKKTIDASRNKFERAIWNYGYHRQAAHYLAGLNASGIQVESAVLIAVEPEPPYAVAVYRLQDDVMACAHEEVIGLLRTYRKCRESGVWPAYPEQVQDISIPRWAMRELEQVA